MNENLDYAYDEYLKKHAGETVLAISKFKEKLDKAAIKYGRFVIPTFYKPFFLNSKQHQLLKRTATILSQIINKTARFYFEDGHLSRCFRLSSKARELVDMDPGYSRSVVFSRFDALLEGENLKIVDFNCDAPAGAAYADQLDSILMSEKLPSEFCKKNQIFRTERIQHILDTLLSVYEEFGGYQTPHIAIVDWRHARTSAEFVYIKKHFEEKGYKTTIADPRELQYRGGKLYHKNFRVDLIYRRVTFNELLERIDEVQDLIKAYKSQSVCVANSLRSRLAGEKTMLSILTNPEFDHFFTQNENKAKQMHLPWTRTLKDVEAFYGNKKSYIIDFLKDEKETLVLKPSVGHRGKGVYLGNSVPDDSWNLAIDKALKEEWIMQEYASVPAMTIPEPVNQKLDFSYKKYNFSMLVSGGKYSGGFVRLSDENVVNVAKGGGVIPALWNDAIPERFGT